MSHKIYTTSAVVLARRESGEGSFILSLLTSDFGLVEAKAQGLRELKSKLRHSLQTYHQANVSLVRGREVWRVVNAEPELGRDLFVLPLIARVSSLVVRLVRGEESHPELFEEYERAWTFFGSQAFNADQEAVFERILVLRLLHLLGYIEARAEIAPLLEFTQWSEPLLDQPIVVRELATGLINQALRHSHL